ncbi:hypothetical protein MMC07_009573 [Pseudocyphellaria aurata]|nr:hypothetical protein [Pseudocyphellaria aurata]
MISPESPSAEHRPPGTPASRNTSQGQSPLDSLYKQIDQEMGWELTGDQWKRPGTTVNERLNQARIFLSDEDVNTSLSFEIHHKRIDNYLRKLAEEEVECDVNVYNEVQCMLRVHKTRIDKQKHLNLNFFEHVPAARLSQRLSLGELDDRTAITGGPLQDDNPHFSTQRPPNLSLFLKNLHDDTTLGQKLRKLEGQGYQEVIKNPSVVNEVLEVRESMNQHKMFDIQARKRGRRRAAIQIALQSFATNDEQHYQGSWQHNVLRLPFKQLGKRPEAVLTIGTGGENEEHHTPPYRWTKRYLAFLKHQKSPLHGGAKERTLQELAQPLSEMQQVFSEHRAVELIEDAILTELHENRDPSKSKHTHDWTLLAESLDLDGTIDYFAPRRWQPAHEEPDVLEATTRKRQAEEALETESSPKRGHFAVDYSPLGGPGNSPSRRLPLEELGFQAHREDSRDHTPDIGAGGLMPREMQQFNYQRDKMALENVLDKLEKHYSGAASFMFGETGYLSALMSREVASVLAARKRRWPELSSPRALNVEDAKLTKKNIGESALEQGHYIGPGPPSPPPPLVLPSERFSLPPLEHTEGFQGRFPPPSCSVDQIFSRKASPPPSQILLANPKMVQLSPPPPSSPTLAVPKSNSFPQKPTVLTSPQSSVPKPGPYIPTRPTPAPPRPFVARPESSSQNRPAPSPTKLTVHRPSPASPKRSSSSPIPPRVRKSRDDFTVSEMPPPRRLRPKLPPPAPFRPSIGLDPPTPFATSKLRLEYIISSKGQLSSRRLL